MKRHIIPIATLLLLAAVSRGQTTAATNAPTGDATAAPAAGQTEPATGAPAAPTPSTGPALAAPAVAPAGSNVNFRSFQAVIDKNIFNANRTGPRSFRNQNQRRSQVDTFALLGTMSYEKGHFAFFGGSSSTYRKTLRPADKIAGYTVAEVKTDRVKLATTNGEPLELCIGMQMRRVDGGPWSTVAKVETVSSPLDSSAAAATLSTADDSTEIQDNPNDDATTKALKRLMKKRKKELSK